MHLILNSFESVIRHNHDLFEQLALKHNYHEALLKIANYAKDLKLIKSSMSIIAALCGARRQQVGRFLKLKLLTTIKAHLQNTVFVHDSTSSVSSEDKEMIEEIHTESLIALSNIACDDKVQGIVDLLIASSIFSDAVFPLYFNENTSFRMKHELAFCVCNSLLKCSFEEACRLMSSGHYMKIIVDVLQL